MGLILHYQITFFPDVTLLVTENEEEFYSYLENRDNSSSYLLDTSSNNAKIMKKRKYNLGKLKVIRSSATISRFLGSPLSNLKEKEIFLSSYGPGSYLDSLGNTTEIVYKKVSTLFIAQGMYRYSGFKGHTYVAVSFLDLVKYINDLKDAFGTLPSSKLIFSSRQDRAVLERYR